MIPQRPLRLFVILATCATLAAAPVAAAVDLTTSEIQIARVLRRELKTPRAALSPSGAALVVWEEEYTGLRGAFVGPNGALLGPVLGLQESTRFASLPAAGEVFEHQSPTVAFLPGGDFLLFWTQERSYVRTEAFYEYREVLDQDVMVQRFDPKGSPRAAARRVNATAGGFQARPQVLARGPHGFVVAWEAGGKRLGPGASLVLRRLTLHGRPAGPEIRVDGGGSLAGNAALAGQADGGFLVVWETVANQGDVWARRFDAAAAPVGAPFLVHAPSGVQQRRPAVAEVTGGYLVAWQGAISHAERRIFGQFFSPAAERQGGVFQISAGNDISQLAPAIARLPEGRLLVTWRAWKDSSVNFGLSGVELDGAGQPLGNEFWINVGRTRQTVYNWIVADDRGDVFIPWLVDVRGSRPLAIQVVGRWLRAE
jgi:hypothetical protein